MIEECILPKCEAINQRIKSITLLSDDDIRGGFKDEYLGYEIVIETGVGTLLIAGCHDLGPEISWNGENIGCV